MDVLAPVALRSDLRHFEVRMAKEQAEEFTPHVTRRSGDPYAVHETACLAVDKT